MAINLDDYTIVHTLDNVATGSNLSEAPATAFMVQTKPNTEPVIMDLRLDKKIKIYIDSSE